jgi:outer membrane protein assembly factor BamB
MDAEKAMITIVRRLGSGAVALVALAVWAFAAAKTPAAPLRFPLSEAARLGYDGDIRRALVTATGALFFSTDKGFVYGLMAGMPPALPWRFEARAPIVGPPALGPEGLLVADVQNHVYALDLEGRLRWEVAVSGRITAGPVWNGGLAFFVVDEAFLVALNGEGAESWRYASGSALRAGPAFWYGAVLIGSDDGRVLLLGPDGRLLRTIDVGGSPAGPLFADQSRIYVPLAEGTLHCFDPASGKRLWKFKLGGTITAPPAADAARLYFTASSGVLFCLDKKRGDLAWWHSLPAKSSFSPWIGEGQVFAASFSPVLAAFKADNGEKAGTFEAAGELRAGAVRVGDKLLINLYDPDTGQGTLVFLKGEAAKSPAPPPKK